MSKVSQESAAWATLSRADMAAYEFLRLQADCKDWMSRVLGRTLDEDKDMYDLCRDGTLLCEMINKMFPGCIKKYHPKEKCNMSAKCIENLTLYLKVCQKMGMPEVALFEPLDLYERKNVMRFLTTLEQTARFVNERGFPVEWSEGVQSEFTMEDLQEAEGTYSPSQFMDMFAQMKAQQRKENKAKAAVAVPAAASGGGGGGKQLHEEEDTAAQIKTLMREMDRALEGRSDTTKLHLAVEHAMNPAVAHMVDARVWDMKKPDGDGNHPLHVACVVDNEFALKKLLAGGAPINAQNHDGDTPLHLAVAARKPRLVKLLLDAGADVNVTNKDGASPLHVAADVGDPEIFTMLADAGADLNARNKDGNTPLHLAAWLGDQQAIKTLRQRKAQADVANKDGNTPLHFAALRGHKEVVADLLEMPGTDVNAKNADKATPLQLATEADESDVVALMAAMGGVDIDSANNLGWTPLYTAVYNNNRDTVNFLCQKGADPNHQNAEGWAPLHAGASQGCSKVVADLVSKYKARLDIQTNEGTTPLFFAAHTGRKDIVEFLLKSGAKVSHASPGGWQPLHGAIYNDHEPVCEILVRAGARLNDGVDEIKGYRPMHIAIASEDATVNVVRMLLAAGADVNSTTGNMATPLHLAVFWNNKPMVEYLLRKGADLTLRNNKKRRPIDLACHYGHKELAELLAKAMKIQCPPITGSAKPKIADMSQPAQPPTPDAFEK